jgi:hypothetical protein
MKDFPIFSQSAITSVFHPGMNNRVLNQGGGVSWAFPFGDTE